MIRIALTALALVAALALTPALADSFEEYQVNNELEAVFDQLELKERTRVQVREVLKQFREDRLKAQQALQELGETLPPREEVRAMTAYSDTVLEYRLSEVLTDTEVDTLMAHFEERRRSSDADTGD